MLHPPSHLVATAIIDGFPGFPEGCCTGYRASTALLFPGTVSTSHGEHVHPYLARCQQESYQAENDRQTETLPHTSQYNMNQQLYSVPTAHTYSIHTSDTSWTSVVSLEDPFHFQLHQARVVSPCLPPPRDDISVVQPVSQSAMWQWQLADEQKRWKRKVRIRTLPLRRMRPEPVRKKRMSTTTSYSVHSAEY